MGMRRRRRRRGESECAVVVALAGTHLGIRSPASGGAPASGGGGGGGGDRSTRNPIRSLSDPHADPSNPITTTTLEGNIAERSLTTSEITQFCQNNVFCVKFRKSPVKYLVLHFTPLFFKNLYFA